jgi:hypothetical protein
MARANAHGPDTLQQTGSRPTRKNPLADRGRAIHFGKDSHPVLVGWASDFLIRLTKRVISRSALRKASEVMPDIRKMAVAFLLACARSA